MFPSFPVIADTPRILHSSRLPFIPSTERKEKVLSIYMRPWINHGLPSGTNGKEPTCQCRRPKTSVIPGSGRSSGGGHGNPLQYSRLENPMDGGAWRATVHGVTELNMTEWLTFSLFALILQKKLYEQKKPNKPENLYCVF